MTETAAQLENRLIREHIRGLPPKEYAEARRKMLREIDQKEIARMDASSLAQITARHAKNS